MRPGREVGQRPFGHGTALGDRLFPPIEAPKEEGKRLRGKEKTVAKRRAMASRALADFAPWAQGRASLSVAAE